MCSPLRYPGGKSCLLELASTLLIHNGLCRSHYAEPFAGGSGLALGLLYSGYVAEISINDIDLSIWAFWNSVLFETDSFIDLVEKTPITVMEWQRQREIHRGNVNASTLELGFAAFFLNRTNRSGVIKGGGVIGGLDQTGTYKIDCRFNVDDLVRRIRRVARYRSQIHLSCLDAHDFLDQCRTLPARSLLFIDPPYFKKGPGLYTSFYRTPDHEALARRIEQIETPWIVTYDDISEIRHLYAKQQQYSFNLRYSLNTKRAGRELLIAPESVEMPPEASRRQIDRLPRLIAA